MKKQKFKTNDRVKIIKPITSALWAAGKTGRIIKNDNTPYAQYLVEIDEPHHPGTIMPRKIWCREVELLEPRPVHPVIVITTDGKTVTATKRQGKKILKKAEARCNCSDHFDFNAGALLALSRLAGATIINADMRSGPLKIGIDELLNKQEPKLFSGKIVCVESSEPDWWTPGKVYEVNSGKVIDDTGLSLTEVESVDEMNARLNRMGFTFRFIPYVE